MNLTKDLIRNCSISDLKYNNYFKTNGKRLLEFKCSKIERFDDNKNYNGYDNKNCEQQVARNADTKGENRPTLSGSRQVNIYLTSVVEPAYLWGNRVEPHWNQL